MVKNVEVKSYKLRGDSLQAVDSIVAVTNELREEINTCMVEQQEKIRGILVRKENELMTLWARVAAVVPGANSEVVRKSSEWYIETSFLEHGDVYLCHAPEAVREALMRTLQESEAGVPIVPPVDPDKIN